jgi:4-carboxymuconolactone decarboxylase
MAPMKIHSSPWKPLLVRSIAFAVLVTLAMRAQAEQNSVEERGGKINRSERAEDKLRELFGSTQLSGRDLDPEFFDIMKSFTYGEVFYQGNLDSRQRELIALVVLTTIQCLSEVRLHVGAALNIGVTPIEIKESLYQCAPFIGFPRVQEALNIVNEVMLGRGISLPLDSQRGIEEGNRFEKGREIQFPIYGDRIKETVSNLPEEQRESIPRYLTELCFGDLYTRAGLNLQTRELLILCVLCALGGTDLQIKSHATGNLKVGNSRETVVSAITFCLPFIGFPRTLNAINIVKEVSEGIGHLWLPAVGNG